MEKKKPRKVIKKLQNRYRLMIYDDNSFQAVWNIRITRTKAIRWIMSIIAPLVLLTAFLIFFTPIRQLIPGYPKPGMQKNLVRNEILIDSLHHELELQKQYLASIQSVIQGEITEEESLAIDTSHHVVPDLTDYQLNHDSIFELHLLNTPVASNPPTKDTVNDKENIQDLSFFRPINGVVTDKYNTKSDHYGVDITSAAEASIFSVLDGTVIFAGFTVETGYVIYVQHRYNLVSVYKHNLNLLRKTGDRVKAGEVIAVMGNTGKLSTGPHLHFELWYKGKSIDPSEYINFE
ncbi:MAG: M23 family metallopeptidase [Mangrovibacterium sp.]